MKKNTIIALVLGLFVLGFIVYIGIQPGGFISNALINELPSSESTAPVSEWRSYESSYHSFSIQYPPDYTYEVGGAEEVNVLTVRFMPQDEMRKLDSFILRVMEKGSAQSLQDWISTNVTRESRTVADTSKYKMLGIINMANTTINSNEAITFEQETELGISGEGVLIMGEDAVYALVHSKDRTPETFNKWVNTLTFN